MKLKRFTKLVAFRATPDVKEKLDELSFKMQLTEGELIRKILLEYLESRDKKLKGLA